MFSPLFGNGIIEKGAFLLPDHDESFFIPRLHSGLDVSSSRRLRIPADQLQLKAHAGKPSLIDFQNDRFFERYLSRRNFESTGSAFLLPFFHGRKLAGALLELADIDSTETFGSARFPLPVLDETASFLVRSRERIVRLPVNDSPEADTILQQSEILVAQAKKEEKRVIFFIVDLSYILQHLKEKLQHIDLFYLGKDLQYTLSLLIAAGGFCVPAGNNRIILAVKAKHSQSQNVVIDQIRHLLQHQCYTEDIMQDFNVVTRIWPDDDFNVEPLLSDFFSTGNEFS